MVDYDERLDMSVVEIEHVDILNMKAFSLTLHLLCIGGEIR
jgi:hypothetical protein